MSIASEITRITGNVSDSYTAANAKGATMPATQDSDHLAATIATIPSGITPTGTKNITTNGTHDVAAYEYADVQVPTTAPAHYIEYVSNNGAAMPGGTVINLNGLTSIPAYCFAYAYYKTLNKVSQQSVDFSTIVAVSGMYAFANAFYDAYWVSGEINLNALTFIGGMNAFESAFARSSASTNYPLITGLKCNLLETINGNVAFGNAFNKNPGLANGVEFKKLKTTASNSFDDAFRQSGITSADFRALETINGFNRTFQESTSLTTINFGAATTVAWGQYMCYGCTSLSNVNISNLEQISGGASFSYAFGGCTALQDIDLNKLYLISCVSTSSPYGAASGLFWSCSSLQNIGMKSLKTISGHATNSARGVCAYMFQKCIALPTFKFQSLDSITGGYCMSYMFAGCTSLLSLWFYALKTTSFGSYTTQFNNMLNGVTGCTVHFPMAIQSTIGSWSDVTNGFGGTSTTVLFDIVTSLTGADTVTYTRQEKDSTSTATAWNDGNDTLFYTSGVSDHTNGVHEPSIGDTIYSDAACTTAVTTISTIA